MDGIEWNWIDLSDIRYNQVKLDRIELIGLNWGKWDWIKWNRNVINWNWNELSEIGM